VSENWVPDHNSGLLTSLRRMFAPGGRGRFILLFLVINAVIGLLLWVSWLNRVLVQEKNVLVTKVVVAETRIEEVVVTCEVRCTQEIDTVAARYGTEIAEISAELDACRANSPLPVATDYSPTPVPSFTATPVTPTPTPTSTETSTPTLTPTDTPTWTPSPTATPRPPTSTPRPLTPTHTPTPLPPVVFGIVPNATVQSSDPPFPVAITGQNFRSGVTARLGANIPITVTGNTATTIDGMLSPNISVGVYGLTVTNPDDQSGTLSPAFTVYPSTTSLESPYMVTFGRDANPPYDSRYQVQLIFFDVPADLSESLYVHIFDADTGGPSPVDDDQGDGYDTATRYTLYGGAGAYTAPEARTAPPSPAGITTGRPLVTATIGISDTLDQRWYPLPRPFSPSEGEHVGERYVFKLTVEGLSGNDANWYRVALSTSPDTNTVPRDGRMFAFLWMLMVDEANKPNLHPYVVPGMATFRLRSFGCDCQDPQTGRLLIRTPLRSLEAQCVAGGTFTPEEFDVLEGEGGATWTVDFSTYLIPFGSSDYLGLWIEDESNQPLPMFIRPTT
jgi:hypothetical protein